MIKTPQNVLEGFYSIKITKIMQKSLEILASVFLYGSENYSKEMSGIKHFYEISKALFVFLHFLERIV